LAGGIKPGPRAVTMKKTGCPATIECGRLRAPQAGLTRKDDKPVIKSLAEVHVALV
jgi:hypothetical protein